MIKRIFTFWEPRGNIPPYLQLCMQTWKKFLPDYEIVIVDYSNLNQWLGKDFYDNILYKNFSLAKQADAIRCALLKKYGGLWFDCDTIVTGEQIRSILHQDSSFVVLGSHVAFIAAHSNSPILIQWLKGIKRNLLFYKKYNAGKTIWQKLLLFLHYPFCYRKLARNLENWNYLGNLILNRLIKKHQKSGNKKILLSLDRTSAFPEIAKFGTTNCENYRKFYFEHDYSAEILRTLGGRGI